MLLVYVSLHNLSGSVTHLLAVKLLSDHFKNWSLIFSRAVFSQSVVYRPPAREFWAGRGLLQIQDLTTVVATLEYGILRPYLLPHSPCWVCACPSLRTTDLNHLVFRIASFCRLSFICFFVALLKSPSNIKTVFFVALLKSPSNIKTGKNSPLVIIHFYLLCFKLQDTNYSVSWVAFYFQTSNSELWIFPTGLRKQKSSVKICYR